MHALITRAMRNVGDDLIHQRARSLIEHLVPGVDLVSVKGWQRLGSSLSPSEIASLESIIVPGGPGARRDLEGVYPFLADARRHHIPVRFLGIGSRFVPGSLSVRRELIDGASAGLLRRLADRAPIGVRDHLTQQVLLRAGVTSQVNGCPAWYSIEHLGARPSLPTRIDSVALTTPADVRMVEQCIGLMHTVAGLLPSARVLVGFHHGFEGSDREAAVANEELIRVARALRFDAVDLACDSGKLHGAYAGCDLHVGYRVHAHIFFASLRKPTFLLAEDSRGLGVLQTLGSEGRLAWNELAANDLARIALSRTRPELLLASDREITEWLEAALGRALDLGFPQVETAASIIDRTFHARMAPFVRSLVGTPVPKGPICAVKDLGSERHVDSRLRGQRLTTA